MMSRRRLCSLLGAGLVFACSKPPGPVEAALAPPIGPSAAVGVIAAAATTPPTNSTPPSPTPSPSSSGVRAVTACGGGRKLVVHFYDVDQALSVLVDLPAGRHILVDTEREPYESVEQGIATLM
jgi:hypothetical protein